jgi:hypothetical protein
MASATWQHGSLLKSIDMFRWRVTGVWVSETMSAATASTAATAAAAATEPVAAKLGVSNSATESAALEDLEADDDLAVAAAGAAGPSKSKKKRDKAKAKAKAKAQDVVSVSGLEVVQALHIMPFFRAAHSKVDLTWTEAKGRHVMAKSSVEAGSVLCQSTPCAAVISTTYSEFRCHRCFLPAETLYLCGGCKFARFCSPVCMTAARQLHHYECTTLARCDELHMAGDDTPIRLLIRLLYTQYMEVMGQHSSEKYVHSSSVSVDWTWELELCVSALFVTSGVLFSSFFVVVFC